jgi:hypothetical protein
MERRRLPRARFSLCIFTPGFERVIIGMDFFGLSRDCGSASSPHGQGLQQGFGSWWPSELGLEPNGYPHHPW